MAVLAASPKLALRKILVLTDFSPTSALAVQHAIAIARHYGSKLHLVHAVAAVGSRQSQPDKEIRATAATEKLRLEVEACPEIECSQSVLTGTALEVVERILSFDEVDLVVVGTHGAKGLKRVATGSAAEHFFRRVHCPVLAIGPSMSISRAIWEPSRILLTTDLQSDESAAARCAALLAREHDAQLALLHVALPIAMPFPDDVSTTARPYFQSRLRGLFSYKHHLNRPVEFWVEFGEDPVAEIVRVARERAIDLVVLSVHREEPWGFHFVHEAYRIVAEAPCPVLITQR